MKKYILFACLAFTLTSCKKEKSKIEINKPETGSVDYIKPENLLQKDFEKSVNNPKVKTITVNNKEVSKEEALKIKITNVSSTTHVIDRASNTITLKIKLSKK